MILNIQYELCMYTVYQYSIWELPGAVQPHVVYMWCPHVCVCDILGMSVTHGPAILPTDCARERPVIKNTAPRGGGGTQSIIHYLGLLTRKYHWSWTYFSSLQRQHFFNSTFCIWFLICGDLFQFCNWHRAALEKIQYNLVYQLAQF